MNKQQAIKKLKKQHSRPAAVKALDKAFGDYIKARDGRCFTQDGSCGGPLQCGHLISRTNYSTRWREDGAFGQCRNHNLAHEYHPETMTAEYIKRFGAEQYEKLVFISKLVCKISTPELWVLVEHYRQKLEQLKKRGNA